MASCRISLCVWVSARRWTLLLGIGGIHLVGSVTVCCMAKAYTPHSLCGSLNALLSMQTVCVFTFIGVCVHLCPAFTHARVTRLIDGCIDKSLPFLYLINSL